MGQSKMLITKGREKIKLPKILKKKINACHVQKI
jgi:hypothetical protein